MSGAESVGGSRPTNQSKSVTADRRPETADQDSRELPTPSEVAAEFFERFDAEIWELPLTTREGDTLREEYTEEFREQWVGESYSEFEPVPKGYQTTAREAVSWGEAVETLLERHEETRRTTINLERGREGEPLHAKFSVPADNRWMANYQREKYAQLKAWVRELVGGERPSGGETEGAFEDPHVVLLGLTGSSIPEGERIGPTRHATALQEAWEPVYQTLRNTLRRHGFASEEWQYMRICEPHTSERGGGANLAYAHEHPLLIVDGEIAAEDLAPVLEKHVEACEYASEEAHTPEEAVTVEPADEFADVAAYMASYCGIRPMDLLERPPEYVAWAAAMNAGNIRTMSRSDRARHAAVADSCKQRYESAESEQEEAHGEEVVRSVKRGCSVECACCGSPWGIDQEQTLTAHRTADAGPAAADGGRTPAPQHAHTTETLAEAWPDARAAAAVGESPTAERVRERVRRELERREEPDVAAVAGALGEPPTLVRRIIDELHEGIDPSEAVGVERLPQWRVKSVTVGEEEYAASSGGGVDMVRVDPRPPSATSTEPACVSCGSRALVDAAEADSIHDAGYVCSRCGFHPDGHDPGLRGVVGGPESAGGVR